MFPKKQKNTWYDRKKTKHIPSSECSERKTEKVTNNIYAKSFEFWRGNIKKEKKLRNSLWELFEKFQKLKISVNFYPYKAAYLQ